MILQHCVQQLQKRGTDSKGPRFFVFIISIVLASGVSPIFAKKKSKISIDNRSIAARQAEAQMVDMPLPVGGILMSVVTKNGDATHDNAMGNGSILAYRVTATRDALVRFYENEMMRLGWNKLAQSSGDEELLIFESPLKMAIIQMRPEKPKKGWKRNKKIILTLHETSKENQMYN